MIGINLEQILTDIFKELFARERVQAIDGNKKNNQQIANSFTSTIGSPPDCLCKNFETKKKKTFRKLSPKFLTAVVKEHTVQKL